MQNSFIWIQFTYHTIPQFKVYNSVVFSIFRVAQPSPWLILEHIYHLPHPRKSHQHSYFISPTPCGPRQPPVCFCLSVYPFQTCHISGIRQHVVLYDYLLSTFSNFILVTTSVTRMGYFRFGVFLIFYFRFERQTSIYLLSKKISC